MTAKKDLGQAFKDAHQKVLGREAVCHGCGSADLGDFSWVRFKTGDVILDFEPAPCDGSLILCDRCTDDYRHANARQE
jgi:hypothetical protein